MTRPIWTLDAGDGVVTSAALLVDEAFPDQPVR